MQENLMVERQTPGTIVQEKVCSRERIRGAWIISATRRDATRLHTSTSQMPINYPWHNTYERVC